MFTKAVPKGTGCLSKIAKVEGRGVPGMVCVT